MEEKESKAEKKKNPQEKGLTKGNYSNSLL